LGAGMTRSEKEVVVRAYPVCRRYSNYV
jgi:hypothetical protein